MYPATVPPRRRLGLLILPALLFGSGCVPALWLPDSSGFLYVTPNRQAKIYDVASGKTRVIIDKLEAETPWPALSPDGKQFAVALLEPKKDSKQFTMRVIVYDLKGKEVHRSPAIPWRDPEGRDNRTTAVFWARTRDKLIVHDFIEEWKTAIYDLESKKAILLDGMPTVVGGTPLRPDDKGFLVMRGTPDAVEMVLVDWAGKEQVIRLPPEAIKDEEWLNVLQMPYTATSAWDRNVAVITYKGRQVRIDTDKRTVVVAKAPADPLTVGLDPVVHRFDFAGDGARVRVVAKQGKTENERFLHLLLWKPGAKKPETVFKVRNGQFQLSPSPDGKWLVVRAIADKLKKFEFLLLSRDGTVRDGNPKEDD